jgi:hypothetical protein
MPSTLETGAEITAADAAAAQGCGNREKTGVRLTHLDAWGYTACDDCAGEAQKVERETVDLSAPLCPQQLAIVNSAQAIGELSNRLHAHALTRCLHCESNRGCLTRRGLRLDPNAERTAEILCDDCAAADRKLDLEADALVALSSCPVREEIIDATTSVKAMVQALKAHDLTQCAVCAATRRPVVEDRPHMDLESACREGRAA